VPPAAVIRHLASDDVTMMHGMLSMFGDAFGEQHTYGNHRPTDDYLRQLLARDTFIALVATAGDEVVGGIAAYQLDKFEQQRSEIYIYDLAVAEAHRRQGVATAMIHTLQQLAAERGVYVIYVQADRGDDAAIALYDKLGLREDVLHFDIPVRPHDG
jgi:aminoglycoside 3-N-acetyltransferase I